MYLIKCNAMEGQTGAEVQFYTLLNLLDTSEWSASRPGKFTSCLLSACVYIIIYNSVSSKRGRHYNMSLITIIIYAQPILIIHLLLLFINILHIF